MADEQMTQRERLLEAYTPLPYDTLMIEKVTATERISAPFRFEFLFVADVWSGNRGDIDPLELIGKQFSVRVALAGGGHRFFNGVCNRFSRHHQDQRLAYFRAEVTPWTGFLTLTSDCRIYQGKTVQDVVTDVFKQNGFEEGSHFKWKLSRDYVESDYCVQYRETDFNFVSRVLEYEGIFYYFEHDDQGRHIMVLTDSLDLSVNCPGKHEFFYEPNAGRGEREDTILSWEARHELVSGKWALRDFHMEMPRNPQHVTETTLDAPAPVKSLELFDYPGEYAQKFNEPEERLDKVKDEGKRMVTNRVEQEETRKLGFLGVSRARSLTPGYKVKIEGLDEGFDNQYVVETVEHSIDQYPGYRAQVDDHPTYYRNAFRMVEPSVHYRPARVTPKPMAHGPQSAFVIEDQDPPKEEIWPDKFGRVKVRFPWDREAKYACWIRVVQQWASKGFGYQWIPRVGDEVLVAFIEGDPDCPVIVGSLYNKENMPPFDLPDNKTQSGIKTHSSPDGGAENYNMLRFEDKKGSEEVYLHAERELKTWVEQDETRIVGASRTTEIQKDDILTVKEGDRKCEITKGNDILDVKLGGITITANTGTYKLDAMQIEVTGTSTIKLVCGGSTIEMTPGMITISAPMVKIN